MPHVHARTTSTRAALPPFTLLGLCGFVFALKIAISKAALDSGADPFQIGVVGNFVAGLLLSAKLVARRETISFQYRDIALYMALGITSVALPTVLSFYVVDRVGTAYAATVYSLSPTFTMILAASFGIEQMTVRRSSGIALGLLGMIALAQQQVAAIDPRQTIWVIVGFFIPGCAALGNIIRSAFWPKNASALAFACAILFTSSLLMAALTPVFATPTRWSFDEPILTIYLGGFAAVSALSYLLNFRLQDIAGPVVFSQIGYWGTGFGVLLAALFFGDVLTFLSIIGLMTVIIGGVLACRPRSQPVVVAPPNALDTGPTV